MLAQSIWTISTLISVASFALAVPCIVFVLLRPREPRAMLAWVLTLLFLPLVGVVAFFFFGEPRRGRVRKRRERNRKRIASELDELSETVTDDIHAWPESERAALRHLVNLADSLDASPATRGNQVKIFHEAQETFDSLKDAIASATRHVHLEYYIFQPDSTGAEIRDLLIRKKSEGVECRLLIDFVGSWWTSRKFLKPLKKAGVDVAFYLPVIPSRGRFHANFRNHRKLAVIDGRVGFTGSQNIGDEYLGRRRKLGPWRDTHVRLEGPVVNQLQEVFVEDWRFTTGEELLEDTYFPAPETPGDHVVQIVPSGPDQEAPVLHHLLLAAVSAANESISIITPYFVPDLAIVLALQSAAFRGVRVQLLIPCQTDHQVTLWAGRSFYADLVRSGVEIYEHEKSMLHSKVLVVDNTWAVVGSANMDERSFRLNFELTSVLYSSDCARFLNDDFASLRDDSRRIDLESIEDRSFVRRLALGLARLAAPLL